MWPEFRIGGNVRKYDDECAAAKGLANLIAVEPWDAMRLIRVSGRRPGKAESGWRMAESGRRKAEGGRR